LTTCAKHDRFGIHAQLGFPAVAYFLGIARQNFRVSEEERRSKRPVPAGAIKETLIQSKFVIPAKAGIHENQ
jgi:hypothetical protein